MRIAWLLVTVAACSEPGTTVRIVDRINDSGGYATRDVTLLTLRDVGTVRGDIAWFQGGATVHVGTGQSASDGGAARASYVSNGREVRAAWVLDGDVVVPTDFDSLAMLTAYAHLEEVTRRFADLGVTGALDELPVYYQPAVDNPKEISFPENDNAAYFTEADAFLFFPMRVFRDVPLAMNVGVVAHEYAHRVVYLTLWGGERFASVAEHQNDPGSLYAWNRLWATDEGIADYFGAVAADDPAFLSASTPSDVAEPRDLSVARTLDPSWVTGFEPQQESGGYARYLPGAVVAAALWRIGEIAGFAATEAAILRALAALFDQVRNDFEYSFGELEAAVIVELPAGQRTELCAALRPRYAAVWDRFAGACP
jgi:hypothetical protein